MKHSPNTVVAAITPANPSSGETGTISLLAAGRTVDLTISSNPGIKKKYSIPHETRKTVSSSAEGELRRLTRQTITTVKADDRRMLS